MLKSIKLGFQLIKYSFKLKLNLTMLSLVFIIGIIVEVCSKGSSLIGGFYFLLLGMFTYQMILSVDISEMIQSTSMKKRLQIDLPVFTSTAIYLFIYTFLAIERVILIKQMPKSKEDLVYTLFEIIALMLVVFIYTSISFKYFWIGFLIFFVLYYSLFRILSFLQYSEFSVFICQLNFGWVVLCGYLVIFLGAALEYFIGTLLYKKPLSEYAFRGMMQSRK